MSKFFLIFKVYYQFLPNFLPKKKEQLLVQSTQDYLDTKSNQISTKTYWKVEYCGGLFDNCPQVCVLFGPPYLNAGSSVGRIIWKGLEGSMSLRVGFEVSEAHTILR